jgi:ABC-type branched-subunit amino acid transport system permease subunit
VIGSVLAAVGGAILASAQGIVTPDVLSESAEITLLIMVFVSGRMSVTATILGAIVIEYLATSTSFISTNLTTIEGIVLIIVLIVEPDGVAGALARLLGRRTDRWAAGLRATIARARARGGDDRAGDTA